jgi:hypothetical protein
MGVFLSVMAVAADGVVPELVRALLGAAMADMTVFLSVDGRD